MLRTLFLMALGFSLSYSILGLFLRDGLPLLLACVLAGGAVLLLGHALIR